MELPRLAADAQSRSPGPRNPRAGGRYMVGAAWAAALAQQRSAGARSRTARQQPTDRRGGASGHRTPHTTREPRRWRSGSCRAGRRGREGGSLWRAKAAIEWRTSPPHSQLRARARPCEHAARSRDGPPARRRGAAVPQPGALERPGAPGDACGPGGTDLPVCECGRANAVDLAPVAQRSQPVLALEREHAALVRERDRWAARARLKLTRAGWG